MPGAVRIPPTLARTVTSWEGEPGQAWLDRLPRLVTEVVERWDLDLGHPFEPGGNISWVAPARRRADGLDAVLKVQMPHPESAPEAAGLRAWAGVGAVRLHDHDPERCALLIERCAPGSALADEPGPDTAARVGAALGARLHRPDTPEDLPSLGSVLAAWADELQERLERRPPTDPGLADLALDAMRHLPGACPAPVLLHGDLNPTNILAAAREPWLAIDAKPMVGDPAYDGPRVVTQPAPALTADPAATLERRLAIVADGLDVDRDRLVLWCVVGAVEMGAWSRSVGDPEGAAAQDGLLGLLQPHLP